MFKTSTQIKMAETIEKYRKENGKLQKQIELLTKCECTSDDIIMDFKCSGCDNKNLLEQKEGND